MAVFNNRGDTLIEVLFAIAIFSLVAVSSMAIMNQGTDTAQRALEITLVRQEIDAQAETLRFLNASYIANSAEPLPGSNADQWKLIHDNALNNLAGADVSFFKTSTCDIPTDNIFFLDTKNAKYISPTTRPPVPAVIYSRVSYDDVDPVPKAEGIWIEAVKVTNASSDVHQNNAGYIDFHIRACWDSPGQPIPVTLGTIVRLYEPIR